MAKLVMLAEENSNILSRADIIVNQRGEEKDRQYGNFHESMAKTAEVFNKLRRVQGYQDTLSPEDVYWVMVCLKLTREAVTHREDNLLDAVAYLGALNNHLEK